MGQKLNLAEHYQEVYDEVGKGVIQCNRPEAEFFSSLISLPTHSSVLDIGCAEGVLSVLLAKKGYEVTAVDISPKMITQTKANADSEKVRVTTIVHDIENAHFPNELSGPFDAVFLMNTIEHLRSPIAALINIYAIMKPKGLLIINTPNVLCPTMFVNAIYSRNKINNYNRKILGDLHLQLYSHDSLTQLLAFAGFAVKRLVPNEVAILRLHSRKLAKMWPKLSQNVLIVSEKVEYLDCSRHLGEWQKRQK